MDSLKPEIRSVLTEHGRSGEAKVLLSFQGLSEATIDSIFAQAGDSLKVDYDRGSHEYERHQQLEELRAGVTSTPETSAGPGVDASAGLERYLRPPGWRRTGRWGHRR